MPRAYVYPNVSNRNQRGRGSLNQRWDRALETNCAYIEVPAHFIKSRNEIQITNLPSGSFLTREAISDLYDNSSVPQGVKYILHSEFRSGSHLQWYNQEWVEKLVEMLINISDHFGVPPIALEIHPGGSRNSNDHLINASRLLLQKYEYKFNHRPLILLENRTDQFISNGEQLARFWETALRTGGGIINQLGIVLDIQQLFTRVKKLVMNDFRRQIGSIPDEVKNGKHIRVKEDFLRHFRSIPDEAIKGVHIHTRRNRISHQTPSIADPIPWKPVFSRLKNLRQPLIINPEVLHHNQVLDTINFCKEMFR